jgi:hypothetical protein
LNFSSIQRVWGRHELLSEQVQYFTPQHVFHVHEIVALFRDRCPLPPSPPPLHTRNIWNVVENEIVSDQFCSEWTIGVLGFDSRRGLGIFLFTTASRTALGPTQPPIQCVPGDLCLGVKRPGREANHSHPSSAEVKACVELHLHSPIRLNGVVLN